MSQERVSASYEHEWSEAGAPEQLPRRPVVSVLMLAYNHAPYLAEAIEGVIAQRVDFELELVIGEDCSSDNTRDIAIEYQGRYPRLIRVIHSANNVGMQQNFRRILTASKGAFIAI